jgi:hypothetical protein
MARHIGFHYRGIFNDCTSRRDPMRAMSAPRGKALSQPIDIIATLSAALAIDLAQVFDTAPKPARRRRIERREPIRIGGCGEIRWITVVRGVTFEYPILRCVECCSPIPQHNHRPNPQRFCGKACNNRSKNRRVRAELAQIRTEVGR